MGKPFDEERAPRMDATSRAAAEIDRVHTLEARIAILETELRACTRLRAENQRLRAQAACLDLCEDCAALVPEGTPEPPVIEDNNKYRFPGLRRRRVSQMEFEDEAWHRGRFAGALNMRSGYA